MENKLIDNFFTQTIQFVEKNKAEYGKNFDATIASLKRLQVQPELLAKMSNDPSQLEVDNNGIKRAVMHHPERPNVNLSDKTATRIQYAFARTMWAIESYFQAIKELKSRRAVNPNNVQIFEQDVKKTELEMNAHIENFLVQLGKKGLYTKAIDKFSPYNLGKQTTDNFVNKYIKSKKLELQY